MKFNNILKAVGAAMLALAVSTGCAEKEFDEITELNLSRCLEPQDLSALVDPATGDVVTFRWTVNKDADAYNLVVYDDEAMTHEVLNEVVEPSNVPYVVRLTADNKYYFKLQATSEKRDPSAWITYDGSIKTYALKDNLFLELAGRNASSVSVTWDTSIADANEVTHLEAVPVKGGKTISYDLTEDEIANGSGTIAGLDAATEYQVTLFYMSASRGSLDVWTTSEPGTAMRVTNSEELARAIASGSDVVLAPSQEPYSMGKAELTGGIRFIGEAGDGGARPIVRGDFAVGEGFDGDIYIENVDFDGTDRSRLIEVTAEKSDVKIGKLSVIGCIIRNFKCGLFSKPDKAVNMTLTEALFEGNYIYDIVGVDGDGFDVRNNGVIGKVTFYNNTIYDGFRTFIRVDEKGSDSLGEMVFENNTVKNVAISDKGLFYIRCPWSSFTINKNLIMFEDDGGTETTSKSVFATTNKVENVPSSVAGSENYYYTVGPKFFGDSKNFTAAQVGAVNLKEDPCYNGKGNFFNLVNVDLLGRKVGASPWWLPYVEKTEDLTQNVVEAPHVWDFSNATLFAGDAKNSRVRDELLIVGSEETPMTLNGAITFNKATSVTKGGAPVSGYLTFLVNTPGSVDLEVSGAGSSSLYVALSDENGYKVQGGAIPSATASVQKIMVPKVAGEGIIYLYSNGPITLKQLAWSDDVLGLERKLAMPKLKVEPVTVSEGEAAEVSVSWEAVPAAASYELKFNKRPVDLEEGALSYTVPAETIAALEAGLYNFSIVALPAEEDIYYLKSDENIASIAIQPVGGGEEEVEKTLTWDFTAEYISDVSVTDSKIYKYEAGAVSEVATATEEDVLYFAPNAKGVKHNKALVCTADNVTYHPITYGGGAAYMFFRTAKAGKLIVTASNGKAAADAVNCQLSIKIDGNQSDITVDLEPYDLAVAGMGAQVYEWDIENTDGSVKEIQIVKPSGKNSPFIYKVQFVYKESSAAPAPIKWNFTDEYISDISVTDSKIYKYEAGAVSEVATATEEDVLYFAPNAKGVKHNKALVCTADNVTYHPITYGGGAAYMFFRTAKAGKLIVTASNGKAAADAVNCQLDVKINGTLSGNTIELEPYDLAVAGMGAQVYEWDIENTDGSVKEIQIVKPSGKNSPFFYEIVFQPK